MCADDECSVALQENIPYEPKLFALIHELKHHYKDRAALGSGVISCGDYDANELIEKGAEVFAAEFIYPEAEFEGDLDKLGLTVREPADVVAFKRACQAKVSYRFSRHFKAFVELLNLTEEPLREFTGVRARENDFEIYKWKAKVGINFNL